MHHCSQGRRLWRTMAMKPGWFISSACWTTPRCWPARLQTEGCASSAAVMDNHLMLVDQRAGQRPPRQMRLRASWWRRRLITRHSPQQHMIPFDTKPAPLTSGIRLGTPAADARPGRRRIGAGRTLDRRRRPGDPTNDELKSAAAGRVMRP